MSRRAGAARSRRVTPCSLFSRTDNNHPLHLASGRYFTARKSLPKQYWTGMERNGSASLYAFPDLSYLSQIASNEPYAHWWAPSVCKAPIMPVPVLSAVACAALHSPSCARRHPSGAR